MARYKKQAKAKIVPPASFVDPTEIPPEKEKEYPSNSADGFRLIEWIYNFFALHEPLMYMIYSPDFPRDLFFNFRKRAKPVIARQFRYSAMQLSH